MVKVSCQVEDYSDPAMPYITVHNHWCNKKLVVLEVGGEEYTVSAMDLITAVTNATNTNRI